MPKVVVEYHQLDKKVVKESLEVESSSSFNPTQGLKKDSPMKDSSKQGEKLSEATSSMSSGGATSPRKALKIEVEKGSKVNQGELQSNDFAKKPLQHKNNSGTDVKLDASGEFADDKAWKPVLTTEQIQEKRGMGAFSNSPSPSTSSSSSPLPTFSNINVGVKSMITQHLNKENTRWVFTPNSSPDIWTGAGYRKANDNNNGISFWTGET
ncbi:MgPa adhesin [Mycoplasmoides genitalium M6282]|nr:MgPa adhesin [Mycoplasmoides genitalium M6282]